MIFKYLTFILVSLFIVFPHISHAETHIYADDVQEDWKWGAEGSPYILEEPLYIPRAYSLDISEGVEVISAGIENEQDPNSLTIGGSLTVRGTKDRPVKFSGLYSLYFDNSTSFISNAVFHKTGLDLYKSTSTIDSVLIEEAFSAISTTASHIDISESVVRNNSYGIHSKNDEPIYQMRLQATDFKQNSIAINNSSIMNNSNADILNQTENIIDARDNWWGSAEGPGDSISGAILVTPWLESDPNVPTCCSNVLFLPGIQASRLYKGNNMLWEPNRNDDVRKMFMDSQGKSIDPAISTRDIISSAFGIKDIYESFIDSMDNLVDEGLIDEWLPVPYDWRKGAYDVVDTGLLGKAYALASTSKTGKITIIAHSNGGLVAKALMKTLEERGGGHIIDKSIFVAVPELGTPQAILSMLHGDSQSIAGGLILSENTSRNFSQNLPGAYGLLPSKKFFEKNILSVISDFFSKKSGQHISSHTSMKNFLLSNSFSKASSMDTNVPLTLNSYLFTLADSFHSQIDGWKPASTTKTLSIFGWGMPTAEAFRYERDAHCADNARNCDISVFRTVTNAGDGTVITAARSDLADKTLFLNLDKIKADTDDEARHADILEVPQLQDFLEDTITEKDPGDYMKYFTTTEPIDDVKWLYIRVYSPVDIHVYDKEGNHTGLLENPVIGVDLDDYENSIPRVYMTDGVGPSK